MCSGCSSQVMKEFVRQTKKRRSSFIKYVPSRAGRVKRPIKRCAGVVKDMNRGLSPGWIFSALRRSFHGNRRGRPRAQQSGTAAGLWVVSVSINPAWTFLEVLFYPC